MGAITPLGLTVDDFWKALLEGVSGVDYITHFDPSDYETKFAAEVKGFDVTRYIDKKEARRMDTFTHYAVAAAKEAIADSQLDLDKEDRERIGVIVSSGVGGMEVFERECRELYEKGPRRISPFFVPMMISDIAAGYISIFYGLQGPNYAITSACASSAHAVGDAFRLIQHDEADVMICGGTEAPITRMGVAGFNSMKALSTRNDDPKRASRPFDRDRDGFVMGEGAGIVVLEELNRARARGAKIYAEVVGVAYTADAYHITAPVPGGQGAARAMRLALQDAHAQPEEVDYINAHGTSTPYNDKTETEAIKSVFGEHAYRLAISSTKSMTGHLLGAAGGVELIIAALTTLHDMIPPTINLTTPDPECDLNYTPNEAVKRTVNLALTNSFGFGGHNVCIAVRKYPG